MCFLCPKTKYVELITNQTLASASEPFGPGYQVLFDQIISVKGWKEICVWVHAFVDNYETTPINTAEALLNLRFMHKFSGGEFDYEKDSFETDVTSYIDGYTIQPIIGEQLRLLCEPKNLPPGPYRLTVTYLLVR